MKPRTHSRRPSLLSDEPVSNVEPKRIPWRLPALLACALVALYFFPAFNEDVRSACSALEKKIVRQEAAMRRSGFVFAVGTVAAATSDGRLLSLEMKQHYPSAPPQMMCVAHYYFG